MPSIVHILFYIFSALAVVCATLVITQNNPVRCVLFLVFTFIISAMLWILAEAEFLALILVLVYVGAVMTLFLFVVMMLNIDVESQKGHFLRYMPFGLLVIALLSALLWMAMPAGTFSSPLETQATGLASSAVEVSNTEALGLVLYTDYILAFELAAVLLLVAIVAAVTLVHRGALRSKRQDIKQQIMTRPSERVRLVSMKSEK
jgi:NADH-quinone oxidoreductase subunit J